jgi:hypothetical protein
VDEELVFLLKKTDTLNQRRRIAGKRVKEEKRRILARKTEIACKNLQIDVYVEPTVRTHQFRTHPQILEEERRLLTCSHTYQSAAVFDCEGLF